MDRPFSFETFLRMFEEDRSFAVDETSFCFSDDPGQTERFLGCLRRFEKPYWAGYCDIPDGAEFRTASELLNAPIWDGKSIRERWNTVVFTQIGGLCVDDWMEMYGGGL